MNKIEFAESFKKRTKSFAIKIIKLNQKLPKTGEAKIIGNQLVRAASSVASNYRAVCRTRSDKEFFSKISVVAEEADESLFWLEVLVEAKIYNVEAELMQEATEILAVMANFRKTAKENRSTQQF